MPVRDAQAGDCLCILAQRWDLDNCAPLRAEGANAAFLDVPLAANDQVTVPAPSLLKALMVFAEKSWIIEEADPIGLQPATVQLVRKTGTAVSGLAPNAVVNLAVSRFVTRSTDSQGAADNWVTHQQRDYSAASSNDPNTFAVLVNDPNAAGNTVSVVLEALKPTYNHLGVRTGAERYPAGPLRTARMQAVVAEHLANLPANRFWSSDLRLVVDATDKGLRPNQTLLVRDTFDENGNEQIEILDHDVRVRYEYAACPRTAGDKCLLAEHVVPMRRGQSVAVEMRILRTVADGTNNDNGLVTQAGARGRVRRNCKRLYAQEELTFTMHSLATVDPPSDMLTVSESAGADAIGHRPDSDVLGRVGMRIVVTLHNGNTANYDVAVNQAANNTPMQTATALVNAINNAGNGVLTAAATQNAPEGAAGQGSVDIILTAVGGRAAVTQLTPANSQDEDQVVTSIAFDVNALDEDQPATKFRKGGDPMRRQLFKSFTTNPQRLSIFVVNEARGGLTTTSLHYLNGAGFPVDAAVRNCISMQAARMDDQYDFGYLTLPHEIGHALTDADHVPDTADVLSLMHAGQIMTGNHFDTKRISGPGIGNHAVERVSNVGPWAQHGAGAPGAGPLGLQEATTTLHTLIAANGSLTFTAR